MRMSDDNIKTMMAVKTFTENIEKINSLDFNADGTFMISSSADDSINIYDCQVGAKHRSVNSKKYGVDLIHFAHSTNTAIHASTKLDHTIRYLSLHDNKYLRYFMGHNKKVVSLCMSPLDDMFLSGSLDNTIRLWDLRTNNCQGLMQVPSRPIAAFDPEGLIFAAGIGSEMVKLYDLRSFDKGPFTTFNLVPEKDANWTGMKFSPDGKSIMIMTNGTILRLIDAFSGAITHTLAGHQNANREELQATFSPDAKYVFCGSSDRQVYCWSADSGKLVAALPSDHPGTIEQVLFNPKHFMLATACVQMKFWIPSVEESQ